MVQTKLAAVLPRAAGEAGEDTAPDLDFLQARVRPRLARLLEEERAVWRDLGVPWDDAVTALATFMDRGKLLRPRCGFWGYAAFTERGPDHQLESACAALELLHVFALVHDDVMDESSTRRGRPSMHARLALDHQQHGWGGDPRQYGVATAVLVGDLAFAMANRLAAELTTAARQVWSRLVTELTAGQFLDLAGTARRDRSAATAIRISNLKSGRYTVTGPLRLGAAVAGAGRLTPELERYGDLVGEAFQLRDDLLGVFGDSARTGKPTGEDLRTGKPTLLLALGSASRDAAVRQLVSRAGSATLTDSEVAQIADALDWCGARASVEQRIDANVGLAKLLLRETNLSARASQALIRLADDATDRCC